MCISIFVGLNTREREKKTVGRMNADDKSETEKDETK